MDRFNENLELFLTNLSKITNNEKFLKYYDFTNPGDKYLLEFYENCKNINNDIANKDEIIFSEEIKILKGVNFNSIWNMDDLTDENRNIIWNYLHTLYIFAYEYVKEVDLKNLLKELKNMHSDNESLDQETKTLLNIVDSLTNKYKDHIEEIDESDNSEKNNMSFELPGIFNGAIGNLAKEIAEEIDVNSIDLDDPSALLKNLLSGDFDQENDESGLMGLVKNISEKIQNKITTGDINESDLVSDAEKVMNNFSSGKNGMPDLGNLGNLGNMGDFGSMFNNIMSNMNNVQRGAAKTNISRQQTSLETKNRLKKKLEEKQKLLAEQEKILEEALNTIETEDLRDIDDLVNEIEGTNSNIKKKKKKKKKKNKKIEEK